MRAMHETHTSEEVMVKMERWISVSAPPAAPAAAPAAAPGPDMPSPDAWLATLQDSSSMHCGGSGQRCAAPPPPPARVHPWPARTWLLQEHRQDPRRSKLLRMVPTVGTFFTPLRLLVRLAAAGGGQAAASHATPMPCARWQCMRARGCGGPFTKDCHAPAHSPGGCLTCPIAGRLPRVRCLLCVVEAQVHPPQLCRAAPHPQHCTGATRPPCPPPRHAPGGTAGA